MWLLRATAEQEVGEVWWGRQVRQSEHDSGHVA